MARRVLGDHAQHGKKFRPPLLNYMLEAGHGPPSFEWVRWALPEVLWIGLLIREYGLHRAGELVCEIIRAGGATSTAVSRSYCLASDFALSEEEQAKFAAAFGQDRANELGRALAAIVKFYPTFPMAWLVPKTTLEGVRGTIDELEQIKLQVSEVRPRRDCPAMELQTCLMYGLLATKSLTMHDVPDLNLIAEYPLTERSRLMGARVRATLNIFLHPATGSTWAVLFWERGRQISPCEELRTEVPMPNTAAFMEINKAGTRFARAVAEEVSRLAGAFLPDAKDPRRAEVLLGLLQRQGQFAADVARMPTLTMPPWEELARRGMAETLIRLKWFAAKDDPENYAWFVNYGLGQEKLYIEHLKTLLENEGKQPADLKEIKEDVEARESWLNEQQYTWLQEVDVGGGTQDKDLRKLAEEAGCAELRNLVFQPLSSVVHGHWNAIARNNLKLCVNPLHGTHRVPHEYARPIRIAVVADVLDLYAESYSVVAALAGRNAAVSEAVEDWYREAAKAGGWGLYVSPRVFDPGSAEGGSEGPAQAGDP